MKEGGYDRERDKDKREWWQGEREEMDAATAGDVKE